MKVVARFLKALADEARLQMLWLLFNHRELCVCDIMEVLDITQSKASRHLATLRHANLVVDRKEAAWSYYSLCPAGSELERAVLETLRARLAEHPGAARLLASLRARMEHKQREAMGSGGGDGGCGSRASGRSVQVETGSKKKKRGRADERRESSGSR